MILTEENYLAHYGILRKSGRYPWGSGKPEVTNHRSFLDAVQKLKSEGMTEDEIAKGCGLTTSQLRAQKTIAVTENKLEQIRMAQRLKDKGYSPTAIGQRMGVNESTARSLLQPGREDKLMVLGQTTDMLKRQVEQKTYLDVGRGAELSLPLSDGANIGISPDKFKTALAAVQGEGYKIHYVKIPQAGTGEMTTYKILTKPGVPYSEVYKNRGQIQQISDYSPDGGHSYEGLRKPTSVSSSRVAINYAETGGTKADGVIYVRPGAKDLSLGTSSYAQVRIAVDGTHYLKGMAVYKEDLPAGVDLMFNTNKSNKVGKMDVLKPFETDANGKVDPLNPFGASIKAGGQRGALNIINEEGDWDKWSNSLPSQLLSKQDPHFAKQQLAVTYERRQQEFNELKNLTNPVVREDLLTSFADATDSASVHLAAAALPRQATKVILPISSMKPTEVYCPSLPNGTRVALVRFPHGGPFEIPQLTVNNRNVEAKKVLGTSAVDGIGIHHTVAERLSGADFDGDHVIVIPNNKGSIKSDPPLEGLKNFDTGKYKIPEGSNIPKITPSNKQHQMGTVSNLITDMTIHGANSDELARAVRHSMVVIDAEKHDLDYKASAKDNGILQLKAKYQEGKGASTLISRAGSPQYVPKRRLRKASEGGPIDKATGKKVYVPTGDSYINKQGKVVVNKQAVDKLALTDDAHTLTSGTSGTKIENLYADHSNQLKALANEARKEVSSITYTPYSPSAKKVYASEVESLTAKLNLAKLNAPRERQAQALTDAVVSQVRQSNPNIDSESLKKIRFQALAESRARTGAGKTRIKPTQEEWNAIQAGAISNHRLKEILANGDKETIRDLATPRVDVLMSSSMKARASSMLLSGYTQSDVADQLGVSLSTLKASLR